MAYLTFYLSTFLIWIAFILSIQIRKLRISHAIIGITSAAYSLSYEILLGMYFGLYYYIRQQDSIVYIVLSGIFIYPLLNMLYALFLPQTKKNILIYSILWIAGMLLFEYLTVFTKTVVFTGWKPIPWSIITYIVTYGWINVFITYLKRKQIPIY